jgi:hypothetical protein
MDLDPADWQSMRDSGRRMVDDMMTSSRGGVLLELGDQASAGSTGPDTCLVASGGF